MNIRTVELTSDTNRRLGRYSVNELEARLVALADEIERIGASEQSGDLRLEFDRVAEELRYRRRIEKQPLSMKAKIAIGASMVATTVLGIFVGRSTAEAPAPKNPKLATPEKTGTK